MKASLFRLVSTSIVFNHLVNLCTPCLNIIPHNSFAQKLKLPSRSPLNTNCPLTFNVPSLKLRYPLKIGAPWKFGDSGIGNHLFGGEFYEFQVVKRYKSTSNPMTSTPMTQDAMTSTSMISDAAFLWTKT